MFPLARRWRKGANAAHCPYLCWCINRPLRSLLETLNTLNVGLVAMPWLAPMAATPCCTGFPYRRLRRSSTTRCILSRSRGEDLLGRMAEGRKLVSDFAGLLKLLTARFKEARRSHRCSSLRPFCRSRRRSRSVPAQKPLMLCMAAILPVPTQTPQTLP